MQLSKNTVQPQKKNHNLAIAAIVFALLGGFMAISPFVFLLLPASIVCGILAWRDLKCQPEIYTGKFFVLSAWALATIILLLHLVMFLSR